MGEVEPRKRLKGEAGANKDMGAITLLHTRAILFEAFSSREPEVRFARKCAGAALSFRGMQCACCSAMSSGAIRRHSKDRARRPREIPSGRRAGLFLSGCRSCRDAGEHRRAAWASASAAGLRAASSCAGACAHDERLLIGLPLTHLAEHALALHLLLQHAERLLHIVVTNQNLQRSPLENHIRMKNPGQGEGPAGVDGL